MRLLNIVLTAGAIMMAAGGAVLAHGPAFVLVITPQPGPVGVGTPGNFSPAGVGTPGQFPTPQPPPPPPGRTTGPGGRITGGPTGTTPTPTIAATRPVGAGSSASGGGAGAPSPRGATTSGGRRKKASSLEGSLSWEHWWRFNRERFLQLSAADRLGRTASTPNADVNLGREVGDLSAAQLRRLRTLAKRYLQRGVRDADPDVRARSVVALAKCGASLADIPADLLRDQMGVREYAILALGLLGDVDAVEPLAQIATGAPESRELLGLTKKPSSPLRVLATLGLGLAGHHDHGACREGIPVLIELMKTKQASDDVNIAAALSLGLIEAREAVPALLEVMGDQTVNAYVRANAAAALGRIGDRSAIGALVKALGDGQNHVRRSAAMALGPIASPADEHVVSALITAARSGADRAKKNFAIIALGEIGGSDARNFLYRLVRRGNRFDKSFAAVALGVCGREQEDRADAEVVELLLGELHKTRSPELRGAYVIGLSLLGHESATDDLVAIVRGKGQQRLREHAALGLGLLEARDAVAVLREVLKEKGSEGLRSAAAMSLGLIGDDKATDILRDLMVDESSVALRATSLRGLGRIGDVEIVDDLGKVLVTPDQQWLDETRAFAAIALGLLADKDETPALSSVHHGINYTSQRGVLARLLGAM